jgi:hypothetical protein
MSDRTLSASSFSHVINAPIARVNIADWLFNLPTGASRELLQRPGEDHILIIVMLFQEKGTAVVS